MKILIGTVMCCLAIIGCGAKAKSGDEAKAKTKAQQRETIIVRELRLTDAKGRTRAILDTLPTPALRLIDENGKARVTIKLTENGVPIMVLSGGDPAGAAIMIHLKGDRPSLSFWDRKGKMRLTASMLDGSPGVGLYDAKGKVRVAIGTDGTGKGFVLKQ